MPRQDTDDFQVQEDLIILCEGRVDAAFFNAFISGRTIVPNYQVTSPRDLGFAGGNSQWVQAINSIMGATYSERIKGLIIVGDNDEEPQKSVDKIIKALRGTEPFGESDNLKKLPVPTKANRKENGAVRVAIMMLPKKGSQGSLENLCVVAARNAATSKIINCADQFCACAGTNAAGPSQKAKAQLRAFLICRYKRDANLPFTQIWTKIPTAVPLDDAVFDPLEKFLRTFSDGL